MKTSERFCRNLIVLAESRGLLHREVAERAGIHPVTLSRILHGHLVPTLTVAERLARAVGTSLEKILAK